MNRGTKRKLPDAGDGGGGGHWSMGLKSSLTDPALRVGSDSLTVTIRDKYPKVNALPMHTKSYKCTVYFRDCRAI